MVNHWTTTGLLGNCVLETLWQQFEEAPDVCQSRGPHLRLDHSILHFLNLKTKRLYHLIFFLHLPQMSLSLPERQTCQKPSPIQIRFIP